MALPGDEAFAIRQRFGDIITRYLAGDKSLIKEVLVNAESQAPENVLARASIAAQPQAVVVEDEHSKKRRRELEDLDMAERRLALREREMALYKAPIELVKSCFDMVDHWEARDKIQQRAMVINLSSLIVRNAAGAQVAAIEDVPSAQVAPKFITISQVALEMGHKKLSTEDYKRIGILASEAYNTKYGERPPKHSETLMNGKTAKVNDYQDTDYDLVREAIETFIAERDAKEKKARAQPAIRGFFVPLAGPA